MGWRNLLTLEVVKSQNTSSCLGRLDGTVRYWPLVEDSNAVVSDLLQGVRQGRPVQLLPYCRQSPVGSVDGRPDWIVLEEGVIGSEDLNKLPASVETARKPQYAAQTVTERKLSPITSQTDCWGKDLGPR